MNADTEHPAVTRAPRSRQYLITRILCTTRAMEAMHKRVHNREAPLNSTLEPLLVVGECVSVYGICAALCCYAIYYPQENPNSSTPTTGRQQSSIG